MDQQLLERKAEARALCRMAVDSIVEHLSIIEQDAHVAFWDELLGEVLERCPPEAADEKMKKMVLELVEAHAQSQAMDDLEAMSFECTPMEFGKHQGELIGEMPLRYLDWLNGAPDFRARLRRYMLRDDVQRMLLADSCGRDVEG